MTALLQHLAQQPPQAALHTLEVLADKVLDPRQGIPAAVQGGVFGEEVLVQVRRGSQLTAWRTTASAPVHDYWRIGNGYKSCFSVRKHNMRGKAIVESHACFAVSVEQIMLLAVWEPCVPGLECAGKSLPGGLTHMSAPALKAHPACTSVVWSRECPGCARAAGGALRSGTASMLFCHHSRCDAYGRQASDCGSRTCGSAVGAVASCRASGLRFDHMTGILCDWKTRLQLGWVVRAPWTTSAWFCCSWLSCPR